MGQSSQMVGHCTAMLRRSACIGAAAMMVKQLGEGNYAEDIEKAIIETAIKLDSLSAGKMGMSTSEVGDSVVNYMQQVND